MRQREIEHLRQQLMGVLEAHGITEFMLVGIGVTDDGLEGFATTEIKRPQGSMILAEIAPPALLQMLTHHNLLPPRAAAAVLHTFVEEAGETIESSTQVVLPMAPGSLPSA